MEKARRTTQRSLGGRDTQVWRRKFDDVGLYDIEGMWVRHQDRWQDGC